MPVSRVLLAALVAAIGTAQDAGSTNFVVRATATSQQLGDFRITSNPKYRGAIDVFGKPDDCTLHSWFGTAVWRTPGFRMRVTTLGALPSGKTFCTDPKQVWIDSVIVTGRRWHTPRGLFIGDTSAKFHQLYPNARRFRNGWGVVSVYRRCGAGICTARYEWVPRLTAVLRNGHVVSFVFPVGAQGE
jgi:hypothetical protein